MNRQAVLDSPARRRGLMLASQLVLATLAYLAAFAIRFDFRIPQGALERLVETLPYLLLIRLGVSHRFRLDRGYWQHVGLRDLVNLVAAATLGSLLFPIALVLFDVLGGIPIAVFLLDWLLAMALMGGVRLLARCVRERPHLVSTPAGQRTFIVGAGEAGEQLLRQLQHDQRRELHVVGLIDDDPAKHGRALHGVPVVGASDELRGLVALYHVRLALIAVPSATPEEMRRLIDRCVDAGVEVKLLPPLQDLIKGDAQISQIRDVRIEDLLGRPPVTLDVGAIEPEIAGKIVLITGAGGSIGSELARQVARYHPLQLILLERAESPLYFVHLEVSRANPEVDVVPVLASVTNTSRLEEIFETYRPDCVFHAAAYKHVPMLEWNVVEGVWNNVIGTLRVARAAAQAGARRFVFISTDKAVNPTSILGATKRVAERIVLELPSLRGSATDFRVVRFGNVLGSDGSVVPLFQRQLAAGGPLTITHPEVRRYFMTIPEAVQLVLQAATLPEAAGRISLLEMGTQMRILDLAEQLVRLAGLVPHKDVQIVFTGLRPGEKLLEELVAPGEKTLATSSDKIRIVERDGSEENALAQRLRHLAQAAAQRDEQALLRALAPLVPEYQSPALEPLLHRIGGRANGNGNGVRHNGNGVRHNGNGVKHNGNGAKHNGTGAYAGSTHV